LKLKRFLFDSVFDWEGIECDTANNAHNDILISSNFQLVRVLHFDGSAIYDIDFGCDKEEHRAVFVTVRS
jgi:hypothetical protein